MKKYIAFILGKAGTFSPLLLFVYYAEGTGQCHYHNKDKFTEGRTVKIEQKKFGKKMPVHTNCKLTSINAQLFFKVVFVIISTSSNLLFLCSWKVKASPMLTRYLFESFMLIDGKCSCIMKSSNDLPKKRASTVLYAKLTFLELLYQANGGATPIFHIYDLIPSPLQSEK